ncbi:TPA: histone-lysine N-methyltransferase substrate of the Dot/Icm secretion system, partial [Legionella pneumophila]|nr:histone-lysine N-methyltransferase substrate of the Dot/Icm secretion system [Legionella pneumophila]
KLFDKALVLLAFYPDYFKRNYMSDNEGHNQFNINAFRKAIKDFNSNERNLLLMQLRESSLHLPEDLLEQLGIMDSSITLESKFF